MNVNNVATLMKTKLGNRAWFMTLFVMTLCATVLVSCGWRMRGAVDLPYKAIFVNGTMSVEFRQYLERGIEAGTNAKLTKDYKEADLIINIMQDQLTKQILSYNASGQITAYRLVEQVKFQVLDGTGNEIMPEADIFLTRDMDFSISGIQASENLEQEFVLNMRMDIVNQLLRRIGALSKKSAKKVTAN